jgi:D-beta-D-heptose 7-phosphate kinase/D-beta-D-heptose 1-phosphate adenosyltransferase
MGRVIEREGLYKKLEPFREMGVVFTNGCFDIIHAGHIKLFKECENLGGIVVVGLNSDESVRRIKGSSRPINTEDDRAEVLSSLEMVDLVVIFNEDTPLELIKEIRPDYIVKGADWKEDEVVGGEEIKEWDGEVVIVPLLKGVSTTGIVKRIQGD